ncbi:MAG: DUF6683 family protein [Gammaproteobacteria bacterium]
MTATDTVTLRESSDYLALDFDYDPGVSKLVLAETVDTLARGNPTYRQVVEKELASRDVTAEYREAFGELGLRHDNLADTMAAYWISMWTVIHNKPLATAEQTAAVLAQVMPRIQTSALTKSARKRQMMGEALVYEATIALTVYNEAKANNQELQLRQMAQSAKKNTRKKGFELAKMKLTDQGMQRR